MKAMKYVKYGRAEARVFRPIIDPRYQFEQFVEADRYVNTGHKKGNVSLILEQGVYTECK